MKSSLILSFIFLIIGGILTYIQCNGSTTEPFLNLTLITGILLGTGIGLFFGAICGYNSKAQSVKRQAKMQQNSKVEDRSSSSSDI